MKHPDPEVWWKHRRRMAYVSVAWAILQTFMWIAIELHSPGFIASAATVIGWSYGTASTIIIGYFGNTAVETYRDRRQHNQHRQQHTEEPKPKDGPWNSGGI